MISLYFLFERNAKDPLPHAQSPTSGQTGYADGQMNNLKQLIGKAGQKSSIIQKQMNDYRKRKLKDRALGVTSF